jgi:hypothetical protein
MAAARFDQGRFEEAVSALKESAQLMAGVSLNAAALAKGFSDDWLPALGEAVADMVEHNRGFLNAYFVFLSKGLFDPKLRARLNFGVDALPAFCSVHPRATAPTA